MATRIPRPAFKTFAITLEGVPSSLSEDMVRKLIEGAVREAGTGSATATLVKPKVAKLRNRNARKAGAFHCDYIQTIGGVAIEGCGRVFATRKGYLNHMDHIGGTFADTRRWPNYCLDAILPPDLRDDR